MVSHVLFLYFCLPVLFNVIIMSYYVGQLTYKAVNIFRWHMCNRNATMTMYTSYTSVCCDSN